MNAVESGCPGCGEPVRPGDRFCGACGTALDGPRGPDPPDTAAAEGVQVAGRYELRGVLGRGASGVVYLAWNEDDSREVVIKALDPSLVGLSGFLKRFRAEANVLRSLSHPNIVEVYDFLEDGAGAWLVMEYIQGASLADVLVRAGRLAPEQALGVLAGALTGLECAHGQWLVHGDIKPSNILVDQDGVSKLADFGQAAPAGRVSQGGTAAYISPEAARDEPQDQRSDVYSAGVVLYEALAGRLPFLAGNDLALLRMHSTEPAPRAGGIHPRLADLLERALAKDPAERPENAGELLRELETAAEEAYGSQWRRRAALDAVVAAITAGAGVLAAGAPAASAPGIPSPASTPAGGGHSGQAAHVTGAAGQAPPQPAAVARPAPGSHPGHLHGVTVVHRSGRLARTLAAHKSATALVTLTTIAAVGAGVLINSPVQRHTRRITRSMTEITTIAGNGTVGNIGDSGPATSAELDFCSNSGYGTTCGSDIGQDSRGNQYYPEEGNNTVQMLANATSSALLPNTVLTPGHVYTVAGNGSCGDTGDASPAQFAELCNPSSTVVDPSGNLLVADFSNRVVRLVAGATTDPLYPGKTLVPGDIYTIEGGATSACTAITCPGPSTQFTNPSGIAVEPNGDLIIADMGGNVIVLLAAATSDALLPGQALIAGDVYAVAGSHSAGYGGDFGPARSSELFWPFGVAVDHSGNAYVSDTRNARIRLVAATTSNPLLPGVTLVPGDMYTVAGNGTESYTGDGAPAIHASIDQAINSPGDTTPKYGGVTVDATGNLYIPEASNQVIRLVAAAATNRFALGRSLVPGDIYTIVGTGQRGYTGGPGPASTAELFAPSAITFDPSGAFVFIDAGNAVVREVSPGA